MAIDLEAFTRGFVAALVERDRNSLQPKRPEHVHGFYRLQDFLREEAHRAGQAEDKEWFRQIVRLRNRIAPGPSGSFDQFETALRDLQLSSTESPNVWYEDIEFTLSKPFAEASLRQLDPRESELVRNAAAAFERAEAAS